MAKLAIIGGTGCNQMAGFTAENHIKPNTPYGDVSGYFSFGKLNGTEVVFLNRHGVNALADDQSPAVQKHIPPHQINYRANIWALKQSGVEQIIAINAVGGISEFAEPASLVIPDQLIDYTWGRAHSYFHYDDSPVPVEINHQEFTEPFAPLVREKLLIAAEKANIAVHNGGTCAVTQGPRLETIAEINRLEKNGCDIVGMTNMPEASLAAELGIQYASIAVVVNWAAGRPLNNGKHTVGDIHAEMQRVIASGMDKVEKLFGQLKS